VDPKTSASAGHQAINFVTLGPRWILMVAGDSLFEEFYATLGIECRALETGEFFRAAGNIGCLSGIERRQSRG